MTSTLSEGANPENDTKAPPSPHGVTSALWSIPLKSARESPVSPTRRRRTPRSNSARAGGSLPRRICPIELRGARRMPRRDRQVTSRRGSDRMLPRVGDVLGLDVEVKQGLVSE